MSGAASRQKGHREEREVARRMRLAGFTDAATSRSESKRADDLKIDLVWTGPLAVQIKCTATQPNFRTLLDEVQAGTEQLRAFEGCYPAVWHRKPSKRATVTMDADDFMEMVGTLVREGIWKA